MVVDFVVRDEALAQWEAELALAQGGARLPLLLALAWHSRQRDPARARALAAAVAPLLVQSAAADAALARARVWLVEAEAHSLAGQLDLAEYQAEQALAQCGGATPGALLGQADACWLLAWIANDRGDCECGARWLAQGVAAARAVGDALRVDVFDAA
ncbi:MAG: hypothetical protein ACEQSK_04310, partial [Sphingomonadaceae bacterium]